MLKSMGRQVTEGVQGDINITKIFGKKYMQTHYCELFLKYNHMQI